jgi:inorganic triphosphatase YgiF
MADHLEIEQKFDVDAGFTLPGFATVPGCASVSGPVTHHLSATYYDTPGTRLAASKITLRRRTGGTDAGWHLKLPAGAGARREIHEPLTAGDEGQVPGRLAAAVAEVAGDLPLAPIAVLSTQRTLTTVLGSADEVIAEVADDVVTARREGAPGAPLHWREVEVEVPRESPAVLAEAARLLLAAGARPAAKGFKLARLLDSPGG